MAGAKNNKARKQWILGGGNLGDGLEINDTALAAPR